MLDKTAYEMILFDWDGTLVNSWPALNKSLDFTLKKMGTSMEEINKKHTNYHYSLRDSFPIWFGEEWLKAKKIYYDHFSNIHLDLLEPHTGSEFLLQALHKEGVCLSVVSNKDSRFLRQEIDHLGWNDYFYRIVGAGDAEYDKPDPAHARKAVPDQLEGPCCMIGDSCIDVMLARNFNSDALLIFPEATLPDFFNDNQPDRHFQTIKELSDYLLMGKTVG